MIQKSLTITGFPFFKKNLQGSMWQYPQTAEALTAAIRIHRLEFTREPKSNLRPQG